MEEFSDQQKVEICHQPTIIDQTPQKRNGIGKAGFIFALLAFVFSWLAMLGWFFWLLGLIFSLIGVFKKPKRMAIAGLVISCGVLIILILIMGIVEAMNTMMVLL